MTVPRHVRIVKPAVPATERELERQAVQRLASSVTDETHWQQILASAQPPQRDELERVVGPLLPFRRAAPCTTPGCDSGEHGIWQPVLVVASPLDPTDPTYVSIELRLCDTCKADADLADFLTEGIWAQVMAHWPDPTMPPVRRLTTLSWERVH